MIFGDASFKTFFVRFFYLTLCLILLPPQFAKAEMMNDRDAYRLELNSLFQTLDTYYGPLELKKTTIGLNWPQSKQNYLAKLEQLKSSNDFYFLISDILNSLNDAHVSMALPSTLNWTLPLQFSHIENSVIVTFYNRTAMLNAKCPVSLGDELVKLNGKGFDELQATQGVFAKYGNPITNRGMFARMLTNLNESRGVKLAEFGGPQMTFSFKKATNGTAYNCQLTYKASGNALISRGMGGPTVNSPLPLVAMTPERFEFDQKLDDVLAKDGGRLLLTKEQRDKIFNVQRILSQIHGLMNLTASLDVANLKEDPAPGDTGQKMTIGEQTPFFKLPADFKRIEFPALGALLNEDAYFAGTFQHKGKTVGFLRIPSYMPTVVFTMPLGLRYIISKLQKTDYLIIDQTNNPGGMVAYSDMIVKSLTGLYDISKHMRFVVKPTQAYLGQFANVINLIESDTTGTIPSEAKALLPILKANYAVILKAYVNHASLSEPISMMATTKFIEVVLDQLYSVIPLHKSIEQYLGAGVFTPQTYQFPVYMMINEFDFSGGDATPATLQDYGRAKLIGVRTAGAGGAVEEFRNTISSDYKYHLTTSLMLRRDDTYVENYGVQPDYPMSLMKSDYSNSFAQVLNKVLSIIDNKGQ